MARCATARNLGLNYVPMTGILAGTTRRRVDSQPGQSPVVY